MILGFLIVVINHTRLSILFNKKTEVSPHPEIRVGLDSDVRLGHSISDNNIPLGSQYHPTQSSGKQGRKQDNVSSTIRGSSSSLRDAFPWIENQAGRTIHEGNRHQHQHRNLASVPDIMLWDNDYRDGYFWITIYISWMYSSTSVNLINNALKDLESRSNVIRLDFVTTRPNNNKPYLSIESNSSGCWSRLGRTFEASQWLGQPINLHERYCMEISTIQHELMHALGFGHEQSRPDRDEYIQINWDNIQSGKIREFDIVMNVDSLGTPYDYQSIMQYRPFEFSNGKGPTMVSKDISKSIGSRSTASATDILQIQLMYQCKTGPRQVNELTTQPCSKECKCWEYKFGCSNNNSFCKDDLKCETNVCRKPTNIDEDEDDDDDDDGMFEVVKDRIPGRMYFMVPGVMFDIQAKSSPIYVTNLYFKGLGLPDTMEDVEVDIYSKEWTHTKWADNSNIWQYIGSTTLRGDGTDNAQAFPSSNFFSPKSFYINSWNSRGFYIQVKNCLDDCNKLRAWEGDNYGLKKNPYVEDDNSRMVEGCILKSKFNNDWETCKDIPGGTSYTFWGGFQYKLA